MHNLNLKEGEIQINEGYFSYKNTIILKKIDFQIKPGELVGIIGGIGSGKSTLLKSILG